MKRIVIIARHEFLAVVARKTFVASLLALPIVLGVAFSILHAKTANEDVPVHTGVVGLVDRAGKIDFSLRVSVDGGEPPADAIEIFRPKTVTIKQYGDLDSGLHDLRGAKLDALYDPGAEYLQSGTIDVYGREVQHIRGATPTGSYAVNELVRASLLEELVPAGRSRGEAAHELRTRLITAPKLNKLTVDSAGAVAPMQSPWERVSAVLAPLSIVFLLGMSVFLSSGYLLQATAEENQNRVIEVVLSSVEPEQLIWGKVLGLGAAGLLQVTLYLILISMAALFFWAGFGVSPTIFGALFVYWMLGHILYAGLLIATGILVGPHRETNQFATVWLFTAMLPIFFSDILMQAPNGVTARVLSYVPLTSPMTMAFRLTKTAVPLVDVIASMAFLMAGIYLVVRGAAKVMRTGSLMYGKDFTLSEVARWLREA